jgi:hypothetical protein
MEECWLDNAADKQTVARLSGFHVLKGLDRNCFRCGVEDISHPSPISGNISLGEGNAAAR